MNNVLAIVLAVALSFLIAFLLGFVLIPWLRKLHFGQTILEIGPAWHKSKQGTPVMGGFMFIISTVVSFGVVALTDYFMGGKLFTAGVLVEDSIKIKLIAGVLMALGFGLIGFADDYIKVVKKRNLGLTITQKSIAQILLMLAYLGALFMSGNTYMFIPFVGDLRHGKCREFHRWRGRTVRFGDFRRGACLFDCRVFEGPVRRKPFGRLVNGRLPWVSHLELEPLQNYDGRHRLYVLGRYGGCTCLRD